ncbi:uncharacterized protein LOC141594527 [Silene latifolia]|uniref:uncharacterized protein LOC141594527 n=1 Tax=Silene latifolia TaxID=37657 RepID=UPI003D787CFB
MSKDAEHIESNSSTSTIDVLSPYYLGNQDGPGQTIHHIKLRHDNYEEWSRSMRMSLKSRRKFGFCDGAIAKPTDPFLLEQWEVVHCTIVQWIMHTIDPSVKETVTYCKDARLLWDDLKERFSINKAAIARQDNERLHKFLMGLDASLYGTIRSNQLALDPLPTLNRAYQVVLQKERLRGGSGAVVEDVTDIMACAVRRDSQPSSSTVDWRTLRDNEKQEKRKLLCSHCTGRGHEVHSCFIKSQKFPNRWGDRPRTVDEVKNRAKLRSAARESVRANALTTDYIGTSDRLSGMSHAWIIDTGASHHVTGDITCLTDRHTISPCPVTLPNGHRVFATIAGIVLFNSHLILRDDPSSKMRIGAGELRDGLYFLCAAVATPAVHRVYELATGKIFVSRDVHFYENSFPYAETPISSPLPSVPIPSFFDDEGISVSPPLLDDATVMDGVEGGLV